MLRAQDLALKLQGQGLQMRPQKRSRDQGRPRELQVKESFFTQYFFIAGEKGDSGDQAEQSVSRVEFEELSQKMQELQRNFSQQLGRWIREYLWLATCSY